MEEPSQQHPPAEEPSNPLEGSPKVVELPPSRWDSPKSPNPERAVSPEPNCAICLDALENKSFTNSCMHQFCFVCLLEWSKVKAECPLCKNSFKSIIHNVRSMEDYDQYEVLRPAPPEPSTEAPTWMSWSLAQFAYSGMQAIPSARRPPTRSRRDRNIAGTSAFRRQIYDQDLWARMQPDVSGRYRDCSPQFYRQNPAMMNRLVPFLQRELNVLMNNSSEVPVIVDAFLQKLRHHRIIGQAFRDYICEFIGPRHASHFCHELHAFATSPFDLIGYDRATEYQPNNNNDQTPELVEVIEDVPSTSNTDTDDSDSDVQWVSRPTPRQPPRPTPSFNVFITTEGESTSVETRGAFRPPVPARPPSPQPGPSGLGVIRISSPPRHSNHCDSSVYVVDSSDSDECTIVGFVKPRHERTPELITLTSPEHSPRVPHPGTSSFAPSPVPTEPFDEEFDKNELRESDLSDVSCPSPLPVKKGARKSRRTRFNSSGSSSSVPSKDEEFDENELRESDLSDVRCTSPLPVSKGARKSRSTRYTSSFGRRSSPNSSSLSSSSSDVWSPPKKRYRSYWNRKTTTTSSHTRSSKPCLRSVATRVPTPPRHHCSRGHSSFKYEGYSQSEDDEYGPSTSYSRSSSSPRPRRDRLTSVLQRMSSVSGEDIWTVNPSKRSTSDCSCDSDHLRDDNDDEYQSSRRPRPSKRKRSSSDSSSSESRHKRRDHRTKKHKKKDRSKSKKSKKESPSKYRRRRKYE